MIKNKMSIKKCLTAASMAGAMVLTSIPAVPVFANTTSDSTKIHADLKGDIVSVRGYNFWTTKVPKANKIPSADKWNYINLGEYEDWEDYNIGADISSVKKETAVYFAKTPNPKTLSEIVKVEVSGKEAAPKYKFLPGNEAANKADKNGYTTETAIKMIDQLAEGMEYAVGDYPYFYTINSDSDENEGGFAYQLSKAIEDGNTLSFRKAGSSNASGEADPSTKADEMTSIDLKSFNRPGVAKKVKIPKRANGPAATINYATHTIKVKNGGSYMVLDSAEFDYSDVAKKTASFEAVEDKKGLEVGIKPYDIVAIRTSASAKKVASKITYVYVDASAEASFSSTGAKVAIVGEYGDAATLQINSNAAKEAYQYVIVGSGDITKYVTGSDSDGYEFDYSEAASLRWKSLKTATKNSVTSASTALKWADSAVKAGSYVFVRKAATKTEYSSEVMIFQAPGAEGAAWKRVDLDDYTANLSNATSLPVLKLEYDGEKDAFRLQSTGAGSAQFVASKTIKGKVGTKNYSEKTASVASGSASSYICITRDKLPEATGNAQTVTFTIPKGAIEYTVGTQKILGQATSFEVSYSSNDRWSADSVTTTTTTTTTGGGTTGGGTTVSALSVNSVNIISTEVTTPPASVASTISLVATFNEIPIADGTPEIVLLYDGAETGALTLSSLTIDTANKKVSGTTNCSYSFDSVKEHWSLRIKGYKSSEGTVLNTTVANSDLNITKA